MKKNLLCTLGIFLLLSISCSSFAQDGFKKSDYLFRAGVSFSQPIGITASGERFLTDNISVGIRILNQHQTSNLIGQSTNNLLRIAAFGNYNLDKKTVGDLTKYIGVPYAGASLGLDSYTSSFKGVANPSELDFLLLFQAGTNYMITNQFGAFAEVHIVILPASTQCFSAGVVYKL